MLLTRRSCPGPSRERTGTIITPVWPCEPLCASIAGGAESLPLPKSSSRIWGRCSRDYGEGILIFRPLFGGRKEKQDKGRGRRWRLRPVTSPRSAGRYGGFAVYQKWGQRQQAGITFAVTIPERLLPQQKNRGQSSLLLHEELTFGWDPAHLRNCAA